MASKRTAHDHIGLTRSDWQSTTIRTMRWVLRVKFALNWADLTAYSGRPGLHIVEYSVRDGFWGANDDGGQLVGVNALCEVACMRRDTATAMMRGQQPTIMSSGSCPCDP